MCLRIKLGRQHLLRALLTLAVFFCLSACQIELNSGLEEQSANEVMSKLLLNGIAASKRMEEGRTYRVLVDESQFSESVELLKSYGLPRKEYDSLGVVFKDDGLISSPVQEWARYSYAKSQELSESISIIPGIISAKVHIARPQKKTAFEDAIKPSASVLVTINEGLTSSNLVEDVKDLVALGVEELNRDDVGVVVAAVQFEKPKERLISVFGLVIQEASKKRLVWFLLMMTLLLVSLVTLLIVIVLKANPFTGKKTNGHSNV
ncbi:type III secretion inner membrane ring lipoprotein SctJ [Ruegeria sp. SCPT10]|uniref:type III secretion system inner membrane ring lipoprotein SctJ n=1 Tax=Ruegeria sp. SCP10 TaxID=3141377 RepID=UPI00333AA4C6